MQRNIPIMTVKLPSEGWAESGQFVTTDIQQFESGRLWQLQVKIDQVVPAQVQFFQVGKAAEFQPGDALYGIVGQINNT